MVWGSGAFFGNKHKGFPIRVSSEYQNTGGTRQFWIAEMPGLQFRLVIRVRGACGGCSHRRRIAPAALRCRCGPSPHSTTVVVHAGNVYRNRGPSKVIGLRLFLSLIQQDPCLCIQVPCRLTPTDQHVPVGFRNKLSTNSETVESLNPKPLTPRTFCPNPRR